MPSPTTAATLANPQQVETAVNRALDHARKQLNSLSEAQQTQALHTALICARATNDSEALEAAAVLACISSEDDWRRILNNPPSHLAGLLENLHSLRLIDALSDDQSNQAGEPLRRMLLAMVNDLRCVVIKLAAHLADLYAAKKLSPSEQQELASKSFKLYGPLANRLGIWQFKWEIEDLGFRCKQPETYKQIARQLKDKRVERERYVNHAISAITKALKQQGLDADVLGRPKHIYSIYKKMQNKQLRFDQLFDVRAIRILVETEAQCYAALGEVHNLWKPIPGQFDDYLSHPKANGYRSIHTAVYAAQGKTLEVQIRTRAMHEEAELGVAAHWRYKEGGNHDQNLNEKIAWLRELLTSGADNDEELISDISNQAFADHIYVVSPKGDIIDLPAQSTPVDFAFHVHTEVGYRCRGAKVNGSIVPLNSSLKNGDQVEILTAKTANPSRDWLNPQLGYATTSKARSRLRTWFKGLAKDTNIAAGRDILERELKRLGQDTLAYETLAKQLHIENVEVMLGKLGAGELSAAQIASALQPPNEPELRILDRQPGGHVSADISVQGLGQLMSSMAGCCHPVPGDSICGFVTRGRGVSIHRADCKKLLKLSSQQPERVLDVNWGVQQSKLLPVTVNIEAWDRQGLIRDISSVLLNDHVNVLGIRSETDSKAHKAFITITVEVAGLKELSTISNRIAQVPNVTEVYRA